MKHLFENMISMIILVILMFVLSSFLIVSMQIQTARRVHASAIEQYQTTYYTVDLDAINAQLQEQYPDWEITVKEIDSAKTRKDVEITLDYYVVVPVFNITKEGTITGYAR